MPNQATTKEQERQFKSSRILASNGMQEAVTFSFISEKMAKLFGGIKEELRLVNPISEELSIMRNSLLPNLIEALKRNTDNGVPNGKLFEVGPQFNGYSPKEQPIIVAGARIGMFNEQSWNKEQRQVNLFDAKADALYLLDGLNIPTDKLQVMTTNIPTYYHPGRSGSFNLGKNQLACFGEVHPKVLQTLGIKQKIVAFEVILDNLPMSRNKSVSRPFLEIPQFQPLERDFAFIIDKQTPASDLIKAVKNTKSIDKDTISNVNIFDVYTGKGIEEDKKSIALKVTLQPKEATFKNKEIEDICNKIINNVKNSVNAVLR